MPTINKDILRKLKSRPPLLLTIIIAVVGLLFLTVYVVTQNQEEEDYVAVDELHQQYLDLPPDQLGQGPELLRDHLDKNRGNPNFTQEDEYSVLVQLGNAYYNTEQYDEATDAYQQAKTVAGDDIFASGAEQGLGAVAEAQGETAKAISHYEKAIELLYEEIESLDHDDDSQAQRRVEIGQIIPGMEALVENLRADL